MKLLFVFTLLSISLSAFAAPKISRGYLYENRRGDLNFGGFNDAGVNVGFMVDYALRSGMLTNLQLDQMVACMDKKETHVIEVKTTEMKQEVPTGIAGRTTFVTISKVSSVKCVSAPGYLGLWRRLVNANN